MVKLIGYGNLKTPEQVLIGGVISEPEKLAKILKNEFKNPPWGKITAQRIAIAIPESNIFTRNISIPSIKDEDIEEAIGYEIEQSIPKPISDLYYDWEIVDRTDQNYDVFFAAAPKAIVDSYVALIENIGMEPLAIEFSLGSISRAVIDKKDLKIPQIIVDIGANTTNIAVFQRNIKITASTPIGAETIKKQLTDFGNVEEKNANKALVEGPRAKTKAGEIISEELGKICDEINKVRDYYQEKQKNQKIEKIIVCGGIANINDLTELVKEKTQISAIVGNPWTNISIYPLKPVPKKEAAMYAAAIGLCLREKEK